LFSLSATTISFLSSFFLIADEFVFSIVEVHELGLFFHQKQSALKEALLHMNTSRLTARRSSRRQIYSERGREKTSRKNPYRFYYTRKVSFAQDIPPKKEISRKFARLAARRPSGA